MMLSSLAALRLNGDRSIPELQLAKTASIKAHTILHAAE
jgi:hypothetical protein